MRIKCVNKEIKKSQKRKISRFHLFPHYLTKKVNIFFCLFSITRQTQDLSSETFNFNKKEDNLYHAKKKLWREFSSNEVGKENGEMTES